MAESDGRREREGGRRKEREREGEGGRRQEKEGEGEGGRRQEKEGEGWRERDLSETLLPFGIILGACGRDFLGLLLLAREIFFQAHERAFILRRRLFQLCLHLRHG